MNNSKTNFRTNVIFTVIFLTFMVNLAHAWPTTTNPSSIYIGQTANVINAGPDFGPSGATYTYTWLQCTSGSCTNLCTGSGCTSAPTGASTSTQCLPATGTYVGGSGQLTCIFTPTTIGTYYFELEAGYGGSGKNIEYSNYGTVTVTATALVLPAFTPVTQNIDQGQTASLVEGQPSGGVPPYSYLWEEAYTTSNGLTSPATSCSNPSTNTCTFTTSTGTPIGEYLFEVKVTDSIGQTAYSSPIAIVNVYPQFTFGAPALTLQYTNVDVGQSETVSASVKGGQSPYTYAWKVGGITVAGTGNSITFTGTVVGTNTISVVATDSNHQTATANAVVTVNPAITPGSPSVTVTSTNIDVGQSDVITANVLGGTQPYSYSWTENGSPITEGSSFTFTPTSAGTYVFNVIVTDAAGQTTKGTATVTVSSKITFGAPSLTLQYTAIDVGQSETVTANVMGGKSPYTYAWYENGVPIPACGTVGPVTVYVGHNLTCGNFVVELTDLGQPNSNGISAANINVYYDGVLTNVSTVNPQTTAKFSSGANSVQVYVSQTFAGLYAYQKWAKIQLTSSPAASGPSITFTGTVVGTNVISVVATDSNLQTANAIATITVNPALTSGSPSVTVTSTNIDVGQSDVITANVFGGTQPYTYAWTENGISITEGNSFTFTPTSAGTYVFDVTVTDSVGQQTTGTVTVTVSSKITFGTPSLTLQYTTINVGQSETVTANVMGGRSPYTYAWKVGGVSVPGTGSSIIFMGTVVGTNTVSVVVTDSNLQTANAIATVTVNAGLIATPPVTQYGTTNAYIDQTQNITLTENVPLSGVGPYTYNWIVILPNNSVPVLATECVNPYAESCVFITSAFTVTGTYKFYVVVNDSVGDSATEGPVTIIIYPQLTVNPPIIDPIDQGQTASISDSLSSIGGVPPYSYEWLVEVPGGSSFAVANSICPTTSMGSGQPANAVEPCLFPSNSNTQTGTYQFEFQVTDSSANHDTVTSSPAPLLVNVTPTVTLTPSNATLTTGQTETLTAALTYGVGPFGVVFEYSNGTVADTVTGVPYNGEATYTFSTSAVGTLTINAIVTDDGTTNPFIINSTELSVPVSTAPTPPAPPGPSGPSGGGASGSGGSGVSGGGSLMPTVLASTSGGLVCSTISNFTQHNNETISVLNATFRVTENYITPTTAGITIGNNTYELTPDVVVSIGTLDGINYTIELTKLSYLPIIDTITVTLCGAAPTPAPAVPAYTQINVTTVNSSYTGTFNLSTYRSLNLHMLGLGFLGHVTSDSSTNQTETITVTKYMGGPKIAGYYELNGFNITISPDIYTTAHVLLSYSCNSGATGVETYQLVNGAWVTPTGASLDATTCQLSWTTNGARTTIGVFAVAQPTTTALAKVSAPSSSVSPWVFIIILLIILALLALLLAKRRKRKPEPVADQI